MISPPTPTTGSPAARTLSRSIPTAFVATRASSRTTRRKAPRPRTSRDARCTESGCRRPEGSRRAVRGAADPSRSERPLARWASSSERSTGRFEESYAALAASIAAARPDAVYLVGSTRGERGDAHRGSQSRAPGRPDHHARLLRRRGHGARARSDRRRLDHDRPRHPAPVSCRPQGSASSVSSERAVWRRRPDRRKPPRRPTSSWTRSHARTERVRRSSRSSSRRRSRTGSSAPSPSTGSATSILRRLACTATREGSSSSTASSERRSTRRVASGCRRARRRDRQSGA